IGALRRLRPLRKAAQRLRTVPDAEVRRLQMGGSAELRAEIRVRVGGREGVRAITEAGRSLAGTLRGGPARAAAGLLGVLVAARAGRAGVTADLSVPVPYNALARGRVPGLVAYAAAPWLLSHLVRLTGADPLDDGEPVGGSRFRVRGAVALGLVLALAAAF